MAPFNSMISLLILSYLPNVIVSMTCKDISMNSNSISDYDSELPCIEIPQCKSEMKYGTITIDQLSNG